MAYIKAVAVALEQLAIQADADAADRRRFREVTAHVTVVEEQVNVVRLSVRPVQFHAAEVSPYT
ncbi:hypothetical protein D3C86_2165840 [compost metagenome]